jgi:hypothetical protein
MFQPNAGVGFLGTTWSPHTLSPGPFREQTAPVGPSPRFCRAPHLLLLYTLQGEAGVSGLPGEIGQRGPPVSSCPTPPFTSTEQVHVAATMPPNPTTELLVPPPLSSLSSAPFLDGHRQREAQAMPPQHRLCSGRQEGARSVLSFGQAVLSLRKCGPALNHDPSLQGPSGLPGLPGPPGPPGPSVSTG